MKYTIYLKGYNRPIIITDNNLKDQNVLKIKKSFLKSIAHGLTIEIETENEVAIFKGNDIEGILIQGENNEKILIDDIDDSKFEKDEESTKSDTILCVDLEEDEREKIINDDKILADNINKNKKELKND